MKIHYLFSKNSKLGSRLISWASGLLLPEMQNVPSHVAVLIDDHFVVESTFATGIRCIPFSEWLKLNQICYIIKEPKEKSMDEIHAVFSSVWGKSYDWPGILFFALCFIRHFLFKTKFPYDNKWQDNNRYFCTEFAGVVSGYHKHSMTTPAKMAYDMLETTRT